MFEIIAGSLEDQILNVLQKTYPVTVADVEQNLSVSKAVLLRALRKLQTRGIVRLEPLPDKTYIRLLRHDIYVVGVKRQRKTIKQGEKRRRPRSKEENNSIMYS